MATIMLAKHEAYFPPAECSVSVITNDADDQVMDVQTVNTFAIAFVAHISDGRGWAGIDRTIAANSGTQLLPTAQRNALQARDLVCVQTHGQAAAMTANGRLSLITCTLTPVEG